MSGIVSARLQPEICEQLVNKCAQLECTKNDFIRKAIEDKLKGTKNNRIDAAKVFPMLIQDSITKCPNCAEILFAELEKYGHKIILDETKGGPHCISRCMLCRLNRSTNVKSNHYI